MILIALGSNLVSAAGTSAQTVSAALTALEANGVHPLKVSRLYRSESWPDPNQPPFVNAAAQVQTAFSPPELLGVLHTVERAFGRVRGERNAPRTLDLDILDYDGRVEDGPPVLPHPRLENRAFVLLPLSKIAPEWRHPISRRSAAELMVPLGDEPARVMPLCSAPSPR